MTDLDERTILTTRARQLPDLGPAPPDQAPPAEAPPTTPPSMPPAGGTPWPRSAKVVTALLSVAALLIALGVYVAMRSDDGGTTDQQTQIDVLEAEQARLTADLEVANARVVALTTQRDDLNDRIAGLDAELATAGANVDALTAQRLALTTERASLQATLDAAEAEVADLEARLAASTDLTATLDERLAVLGARVDTLLERAVTAEQERDALLELFPIEFGSSLQGVDVTGFWTLTWDEAYCTGFATCGTVPTFTQVAITSTPEGWLRVSADGVFDAGLFEVEGALYAITASTAATPACELEPRLAHVGMTIYARDITVADDGTHRIDNLGATYVVDAPATATCPAGVAVYSAALTPVG